MKRILSLCLTLWLGIASTWAATITAAGAGNWAAGGTWTGGVVPAAGDTADLNGKVVQMRTTADGDLATIPATGTLTAITSSVAGGQLVLVMTAGNTYAINASSVNAGSSAVSTGLVNITGAVATSVGLTITADGSPGVIGGTTASGVAVYHSSTGTVTIIGKVNGGSATSANGVVVYSSGPLFITGPVVGGTGGNPCRGINKLGGGNVTITGSVDGGSADGAVGLQISNIGTISVTGSATGGAGNQAHGIQCSTYSSATTVTAGIVGGTGLAAYGVYNVSTGTVTIGAFNLTNSTGGVACGGKPPVWSPGAANYLQWYANGATTNFPQQLAPGVILSGNVHGSTTGTYVGPSNHDVRNATGFGVADSGVLVLPTAAQVQTGVGFGYHATEYTGTLAGGGGLLVNPGMTGGTR